MQAYCASHAVQCRLFNLEVRMPKQSPPKSPAANPPKVKAAVPAKSRNPFALNQDFNQQSRKLLGKHYRAEFGAS
jgi:hypothetical protein